MDTSYNNPILNLAEVQAFSPSGVLLQPIGAVLSSTYSTNTASKCIDGNTGGDGESGFCHSDNSADGNPFLVVDYGKLVEIGRVRVYNRKDCGCVACVQQCTQRIAGATVSITADKDGREVVWLSTFDGAQSTYTFQVAAAGV